MKRVKPTRPERPGSQWSATPGRSRSAGLSWFPAQRQLLKTGNPGRDRGRCRGARMTQSLCESCRWMREVTTPRSRFLLCELSKTNRGLSEVSAAAGRPMRRASAEAGTKRPKRSERWRNRRRSCSSAPATTTAAGSPRSCSTRWPARWGCRGGRRPGAWPWSGASTTSARWRWRRSRPWRRWAFVPPSAVTRLPAQVTTDDLEQADVIVALKHAEHLPLLQERFPAWAEKVEFWHVDDAPEVLGLIERRSWTSSPASSAGAAAGKPADRSRTRAVPPAKEPAKKPVTAQGRQGDGGPARQGRDDGVRRAPGRGRLAGTCRHAQATVRHRRHGQGWADRDSGRPAGAHRRRAWRSWATRSSGSGADEETLMLPLYHDPRFTFRFAEDRIDPSLSPGRRREPGGGCRSSGSTPAPASGWACWRRRPWARAAGWTFRADHRSGRRGVYRCRRTA